MTIFTALVDALHAGYEVLGAIQDGYLLRLTREDGTASFGIVKLKHESDAFELNTSADRRSDSCIAGFELSFQHGVAVVKVNGDIDVDNVAAFEALLDSAAMTYSSPIVVALTMTEYVCRRAYSILSKLQARLEKVGQCLCISCDPNTRPRRTMPLLAVPFPIFDHVDDAVAALRQTSLST